MKEKQYGKYNIPFISDFVLVRRGGMCRTDGKTLHNQRSRIILHSEDQRSVCMELERSVCKAACPVYDAYRLGWGKTVLQSQSCRRGTCELGKLFQFFRCIDIRYNENIYAYRISIVYADAGQKNSEEFKTLVTKVLGGCLADHMMKYSMWCGENSSLFMVTLYPEYMEIAIARNDAGKSWLEALERNGNRQKLKTRERRRASAHWKRCGEKIKGIG